MADPEKEFNDTIVTFEGGVNRGEAPYVLPKNVLTNAINVTNRGGFVTPRPPFQKITLNFGSNTDVQNAVLNGFFQAMCYYAPDAGSETLMAAISGRLFQFTPSANTNTATVVERTIPGDPDPATATLAWMWQSENYVIWNDGASVPVFFNGVSSRRSNTASQQLGITSVDFVVPQIGQPVTVTLVAPYTGPVPATIFVDNATYQTQLAAGGYGIALTNLYDVPGTVHNVGEQIIIIPKNLGYMTNTQPIPPGTYAVGTLTLTLKMSEPITPGLVGKHVTVGGFNWNIAATSVPFQEIIIKNLQTVHGGVTFNPGTLVTFTGTVPPNTVLGSLVSGAFVAPPFGVTAPASMNVPFTGTPGTVVFIGTGQYSITGSPAPPPGNTITLININDAPGTAGNANVRGPGPPGMNQTLVGPGILFSIPELPAGRMGAYGMGRNWISLTDGRQFLGGDIVGGPSGTPSLQNRDSVLRVTENLFLAGGGTFVVPGNPGSITSMTFSAVLDASLGQGALQVGTPNGFFSVNTPVVREVWAQITNPILTEPMLAPGPLGQDSTDNSNSDIMFRSTFGAGSLKLARRDFDQWGNTPISHEVDPIFDADDPTLLIYGTSIQFDNRRIYGTTPIQGPQGIYHKSLVTIQLDAISSLRGKSPSCWESQWTGLNVFRMRQGMFNGVRRAFAFTYNANAGEIELYELLPESSNTVADNQVTPIISIFETPLLFKPDPSNPNPPFMRLANGELICDQLVGRVDYQVQFRSDSDPCWHDWHEWSVCASAPNPLSPNPQPTNLQPQFRKPMGFGNPPTGCDDTTGKPWRDGFWFQARFIVQGSYRMLRARFRAYEITRPNVAPQICGDEDPNKSGTDCPPCRTLTCDFVSSDIDVYTLQNGTLYQNAATPVTIPQPPGVFIVPQGTIQFVVSAQPLSPLRLLGCQCEIVRDIDGMTPDQIAAVAQEMVNEATVQFGQCQNQKPIFPFVNQVQQFNCPDGKLLIGLINNPPLPAGVSLIDGVLVITSGIIASTISVDDANARALSLLSDTFNNLLAQGKAACGYYNAQQIATCSDGSTRTEPAFSIFSLVSQADADARALMAAQAQCDFTTSLGGWWKLNDFPNGTPSNGRQAADSSGNGNFLIAGNGSSWVTGRNGISTAYKLPNPATGIGELLRREAFFTLTDIPSGRAAWSMTLWVRRDTLVPTNAIGVWFGFGDASGAGSRALILRSTTDLVFEDLTGGNHYPLPADTNFHHYAFVWPGGNISLTNLQVYVDSVLKAPTSVLDVTPNIPAGDRDLGLSWACGQRPTPATDFDEVTFSDARLYTIALTAQEVLAIYSAPPPT